MFASRRALVTVRPLLSRGLTQASFKEKITKSFSSLLQQVHVTVPSADAGRDATTLAYNRMKGTILELMAKNMSSDDKEFLLTQWGQPPTKLKMEAEESTNLDLPAEEPSLQKKTDTITKENLSSKVKVDDCEPTLRVTGPIADDVAENLDKEPDVHSAAVGKDLHPIFGMLLADVGYKKVYLTSARRLVHAQVWQKQRTLRPERSEGIAQVKTNSQTGFPGVITLFSDEESDTAGIVDGQHRVGALLLMMRDEHWPADELNILIEVYNFKTTSLSLVENLFIEINSAEPVKAIDMPVGSDDDMDFDSKKVINETVQELADRYSTMFKPTSRCRPPHLHADTLREDLFSTDYLRRKDISNVADAVAHFEELNAAMSQNNLSCWGISGTKEEKKGKNNAKLNAVKKAEKFKFYLGLSKRWLHE